MSVNAIVKKTGITHNAIGAYLEGRSEPTQSSLEKISKAYGKSVAWLRGDVENDAPFMINGVPLEPMPGPSGLIPVVSQASANGDGPLWEDA
jgi:transcriptional regulator with XRE-family HTH domain